MKREEAYPFLAAIVAITVVSLFIDGQALTVAALIVVALMVTAQSILASPRRRGGTGRIETGPR